MEETIVVECSWQRDLRTDEPKDMRVPRTSGLECPECGNEGYMVSGCFLCPHCGYSPCG
jgi:hypothetical protein